MGWIKAVGITLLITGNLFPEIGGLSLAAAGAAVVAFLLVGEILRFRRSLVRPLVVLSLLFIALVMPVWHAAPVGDYGAEKVQKLMTTTPLTAASMLLLRDKRELRALLVVWFGAGCVLSLAVFMGATVSGRARGFGTNPLWLGRELGTGLLIAIWLLWTKRIRWPISLMLIPVLAAALAATGSRGPLLAVLVALILSRIRVRESFKTATVATGLLVSSAIIVVFSALPTLIPERYRNPFDGQALISNSDRLRVWGHGWDLVVSGHVGSGWGSWNAVSGMLKWPHNIFLEVAVEAGWFSFAVFVGTLTYVFLLLVKKMGEDPDARLVFMLLVANVVNCSVSGDVNARSLFAVLALGLVVCLSLEAKGARQGAAQERLCLCTSEVQRQRQLDTAKRVPTIGRGALPARAQLFQMGA